MNTQSDIYSDVLNVFVLVFIHIHTLCIPAAMVQVSLHICADLPEPSLLADVIRPNKKNMCGSGYALRVGR